MMQEELVVKLADGTVSTKACGSVRLRVKAKNTEEVLLDFFVIDGPNNLLGRYALEKLWPSEYNALRRVATVSAAVLQKQRQQQQETPPRSNIPGMAESYNGGKGSNEAQNSRSFPGKGMSYTGGKGSNEAYISSRSAKGADTSTAGNNNCESGDMVTSQDDAKVSGTALPEMRQIPPLRAGEVTQEIGERYCRLICDTYPEVFDGKKGKFLGAEATMYVKDGHMEELMKIGARPAVKEPFGMETQYNEKLDELLEDCIPISGHEVIVASQVVPVCEVKDQEKKI